MWVEGIRSCNKRIVISVTGELKVRWDRVDGASPKAIRSLSTSSVPLRLSDSRLGESRSRILNWFLSSPSIEDDILLVSELFLLAIGAKLICFSIGEDIVKWGSPICGVRKREGEVPVRQSVSRRGSSSTAGKVAKVA